VVTFKVSQGGDQFAAIYQTVVTESPSISSRFQNIFCKNRQLEQIAGSPCDQIQIAGDSAAPKLIEILE
jgi:hypothetical protein